MHIHRSLPPGRNTVSTSWPSTHQALLKARVALTALFNTLCGCALCNAYAALGAESVSILISTGDGGVPGQSESRAHSEPSCSLSRSVVHCSSFPPSHPGPHTQTSFPYTKCDLCRCDSERQTRNLSPLRPAVSRTTLTQHHTKPLPRTLT